MSTSLRTLGRSRSTRQRVELAFVGAFVVAELIGLWQPLAGGVCEAVLMIAAINLFVLAERDSRQPLLLALAVVCLYRLLALTPLPGNDFTSHVVLAGAPMLVAALLALRALGTTWPALRIDPRAVGFQVLVAATGVPLAFVAYKLLDPGFVVSFTGEGHSVQETVTALALVVFSGIGEEVLFRSLVHTAARSTFGDLALYVSAPVFAAAYIGARSVPFVLFALAVGAFFGWCYERTGSVAGVAIAHSLISVGVFVVLPSLVH